MGMSIEGFKGDFLELMNKVAKRRNKGKGRGVVASTKYDRELKKLEWNVKCIESQSLGAQGRGARGSIVFL